MFGLIMIRIIKDILSLLRYLFEDIKWILGTGIGGFSLITLADWSEIVKIVTGCVTIACTIAITIYKIKKMKKKE